MDTSSTKLSATFDVRTFTWYALDLDTEGTKAGDASIGDLGKYENTELFTARRKLDLPMSLYDLCHLD
jgi:hypothetical protein